MRHNSSHCSAVNAVPRPATTFRKARSGHGDRVDIALDGNDGAAVGGGLAGAVMIVEARAFVEERRLGRIEVFGRHAGIERAAAEGDHPAGPVLDREDDAVAEAVVGDRDPVAMDEQSSLDHHVDAGPLRREMIAQREPLALRVAQPEGRLEPRRDPAAGEVVAPARARCGFQGALEEGGRHLQNLDEARTTAFRLDAVGR